MSGDILSYCLLTSYTQQMHSVTPMIFSELKTLPRMTCRELPMPTDDNDLKKQQRLPTVVNELDEIQDKYEK